MPASITIFRLLEIALGACETFERYRGDLGKLRFLRERNSLVKAVSRFGYECHRRGWDFSAEEIVNPILEVIRSIRGRESEIKTWLPIYLERAIDRHVRIKSEEYSAAAKAKKSPAYLVPKIVGTTQQVVIREPTQMECLAAAYGDKKTTIRKNLRKAKAATAKPVAIQEDLL